MQTLYSSMDGSSRMESERSKREINVGDEGKSNGEKVKAEMSCWVLG